MIIFTKEEDETITINGITLPKYVEINGERIEADVKENSVKYIYIDSEKDEKCILIFDFKNLKIYQYYYFEDKESYYLHFKFKPISIIDSKNIINLLSEYAVDDEDLDRFFKDEDFCRSLMSIVILLLIKNPILNANCVDWFGKVTLLNNSCSLIINSSNKMKCV